MTRTDLISNWTHLFLDSHGRIGRRDFWLGSAGWVQIVPHVINALCLVVGVALGALGLIVAFFSGRTGAATGALFGGVMAWAGLLLTVFGIGLFNTGVFVLWLGLSHGQDEINRYGPPQHSVI